jgi:hypothetical protein
MESFRNCFGSSGIGSEGCEVDVVGIGFAGTWREEDILASRGVWAGNTG